MGIGLFQPDVSQTIRTDVNTGLSNINFQNSHGQMLNLNDLKGKVIFINFWATWCPPCIAEMPSIDKLYKRLKDDKEMVFIMVDVDHDFNKSIPFMDKNHFTMPLYETNSKIPESMLSGSIPTTVIFDKSGHLFFTRKALVTTAIEVLPLIC